MGYRWYSGQIFILQARPETVSSQEDKNQRLQLKSKKVIY